ncbi:MAG: DNA cytosine methyltransferase [Synergistaceae bacterium]|nr:DNA cytosine methyltransferase [Synergistaceae bacterium]
MAGEQKGTGDTRYLWPEFSRLVGELRPRWVLAENVPGILKLAANRVCADLERQGYSVGIWDYEAAAVGAPHRRERVFFVAHAGRELLQGSEQQGELRAEAESWGAAVSEQSGSAHAANPDGEQCEEQRERFKPEPAYSAIRCSSGRKPEPRMGGVVTRFPAGVDGDGLSFWDAVPEPAERTARGVKDRVSRLRALGNAVVPQQAFPLFRTIIEADREEVRR